MLHGSFILRNAFPLGNVKLMRPVRAYDSAAITERPPTATLEPAGTSKSPMESPPRRRLER